MQTLDPRWQSWAQAITSEGTTLAGRKWSGKNRPFRRWEYEDGMRRLEAAGYLIFMERRGYRPNRAGGWRFILEMARGLATLPPPPPGVSSRIAISTVRRARRSAHKRIHTSLRRESRPEMKSVMVHQSKVRSIFYLYNDQGKCVARLEKPFFVTAEEQQKYAERYRREHPEDFPGERDEAKNV